MTTMKRIQSYILSGILAITAISPLPSYCQDFIEIDPLFEYPMAPEELEGLTAKSNYLMEHFWDPMDFKNKTAVDQNALNDAMNVFSAPLRWADKSKAEAALDKLIDKISKNPTLLLQFTKAAEETMYSPRAEVWIDDVYIKFLNAFVKNKKMTPNRKERYQSQLTTLENTRIGNTPPVFTFTGRDGKQETYMPMSTMTLIIFGNPYNTDWRLARLKLETNLQLSQAIDQGKLNILYLVPFEDSNWESQVNNYPDKWTVGNAPEAGKLYDLRLTPSLYLIGNDGKIIMKNNTLDTTIKEIFQQLEK